jgi:ABC-2 type transport system permease protein
MRLFWELARLAFRRQMTYRAANLAGLATNFFFGLLRVAVLVALYGARQEMAGLSIVGAITFTGLSQAIIACFSLFGWAEVANSVYTGDVSSDLLKPMNYFGFWLAADCGRATAALLVRGVTIMLGYALLFPITAPRDLAQWLALVVALALAWLVNFSWRFLVNLVAFWTPDARGVVRFGYVVMWIMSGFIMPLRLYPDWFIRLCQFTPFPAMVATPLDVYLNVLTGPAAIEALLGQALWAVLLVAAGQAVLRLGVRRLVIQGG